MWDRDRLDGDESYKANTENWEGETGDLKQPWFPELAKLRKDKDCLVEKKGNKNSKNWHKQWTNLVLSSKYIQLPNGTAPV